MEEEYSQNQDRKLGLGHGYQLMPGQVGQGVRVGGASNPQLVTITGGRTGISLLRLDDSLEYGRYVRAAADLNSSGAWRSLTWATPVEEDLTAFDWQGPVGGQASGLYRPVSI